MKLFPNIILSIFLLCSVIAYGQQKMNKKAVLVIHGGAGVITKDKLSPEKEKEYRTTMAKALQSGYKLFKKGKSSEDIVVEVISLMEDSPLFNAGKGSVLNAKGEVEMDASLMNGQDLSCGSVSLVKRLKNPIQAAQLVKNKTKHVYLAGEGADHFGEKNELAVEPPEYFQTERRLKQLENKKKKANEQGSLENGMKKYGTVGAVCLDVNGNISAGTSTGGTSNKLKGRIGDSPIIGSGTYAKNKVCGVSSTGDGEYFIRSQVAISIAHLMEYKGLGIDAAMDQAIKDVGDLGGSGGVVGLDSNGNYNWSFNSPGMYRGVIFEDGVILIQIFQN